MHENKITARDLVAVVDKARDRLSLLKTKHPKLDAYLVFSSSLGQADINLGTRQLLKEFPLMFPDAHEKEEIEREVTRMNEEEKLKDLQRKLNDKLVPMLERLQVDGATQVELRFGQLHYETVWALQSDELVDRKLTPQTRSSIRIVLGTVASFLEI